MTRFRRWKNSASGIGGREPSICSPLFSTTSFFAACTNDQPLYRPGNDLFSSFCSLSIGRVSIALRFSFRISLFGKSFFLTFGFVPPILSDLFQDYMPLRLPYVIISFKYKIRHFNPKKKSQHTTDFEKCEQCIRTSTTRDKTN